MPDFLGWGGWLRRDRSRVRRCCLLAELYELERGGISGYAGTLRCPPVGPERDPSIRAPDDRASGADPPAQNVGLHQAVLQELDPGTSLRLLTHQAGPLEARTRLGRHGRSWKVTASPAEVET